jgi:putative ABC transport system permease protein
MNLRSERRTRQLYRDETFFCGRGWLKESPRKRLECPAIFVPVEMRQTGTKDRALHSVINGLNMSVSSLVAQFGTNVLWVFRLPFLAQPTPAMLARKQITYDDMVAMSKLPHVVASTAALQFTNRSFGVGSVVAKFGLRKAENISLEGDTPANLTVYNKVLSEGRFFTNTDQERAADVTVLGHDVEQTLLGSIDPIEVVIAGRTFTVIGVYEKQKTAFGGGNNPNDSFAYFTISTFRKLHPEMLDYWISAKFDDQKNKALVTEEIRKFLRRRRKVRNEAEDNFAIFGSDSITRLWDQVTGSLFLLMFGLSSVGLMVGGIGVMNIMLVSVTERTREIGVRKAIGATKQTILLQFTVEAIVLCAVGGVLGICGGSVIALVLGLSIPSHVSLIWITVAFLSSCGIGLVFGIYPAWKASNLGPIDALRYE